MSDAERSGAGRERLDWGDAATEGAEPADGRDAAEGVTDSADGSADEGELCVIEDPTCEACQ